MEDKQRNKITLKKLTIARITTDSMQMIKGGSSLGVTENLESEAWCDNSHPP